MCALAPSLGVLVAGRVIQGVGGGIFPLAFGIIRETFPPERVATAIGGTMVMLVAGPWAGRLATRASSRLPLVLGTFFGMPASIFYALFHGSEWEICVGGALLGAGIGFSFASMANLVVESVPREEVGVATGINTIMRSLGGALGAQLVASLLTGNTIAGSAIPAEAAYTDAFVVAAIAAGLATVVALAIPRSRRPQAQTLSTAVPAAA